VFFLTSSQLVGADKDSAIDVYDAHTCSGASACPPGAGVIPPACSTTDSCRAAPAAQPGLYGAPSSATFTGQGNPPPAVARPVVKKALTRAQKLTAALKICRRDRSKRRRETCEKAAKRSYGPIAKKKPPRGKRK
jgi:hypothetical protein